MLNSKWLSCPRTSDYHWYNMCCNTLFTVLQGSEINFYAVTFWQFLVQLLSTDAKANVYIALLHCRLIAFDVI